MSCSSSFLLLEKIFVRFLHRGYYILWRRAATKSNVVVPFHVKICIWHYNYVVVVVVAFSTSIKNIILISQAWSLKWVLEFTRKGYFSLHTWYTIRLEKMGLNSIHMTTQNMYHPRTHHIGMYHLFLKFILFRTNKLFQLITLFSEHI